jgi:hypothetical protein
MSTLRTILAGLGSSILVTMAAAAGATETLAIVGATVIDISDFGTSDSDLVDSVVIIEDGVVTAVGPRENGRDGLVVEGKELPDLEPHGD